MRAEAARGAAESPPSARKLGWENSAMTLGEFLESSTAQIVIGLAVVAALCAVGYYLLTNLRRSIREEDDLTGGTLMSQFETLRDEGQISEEEYQNVRARLRDRMMDHVKGPPAKG